VRGERNITQAVNNILKNLGETSGQLNNDTHWRLANPKMYFKSGITLVKTLTANHVTHFNPERL